MQEKNEKLEEKQKLELINSLTAELTSNAGVKNEQDEPASKENALTNEKGFLMNFLHSDRSLSAESIYELT